KSSRSPPSSSSAWHRTPWPNDAGGGSVARWHLERVFPVLNPPRRFLGHQLDFGADWKREVRNFVARWKIHQNRHVQVRHEIEQEILELVFLRAVEREVAEHYTSHATQQPGRTKVHESFISERHRVARLLDEKDRSARIDLVRRSDRLLDQR